MPFTPGNRIGAYEITGALGAGGMGEVYRARDTRLGREAAIKILPDVFASDPERLARFEREAQTLASLNHSNIAQVYGFEPAADGRALVMEYVDGEDLAERLARGPIPLDDALPIARQIAEALEAAHEAGIIHRDLKPANVKVRPDGTVKVLDFGLAKAVDPRMPAVSPVSAPTITSPAMTHPGMILGSAAYMAPEQARGKAVDRRADIWAFGCVLYEMLSGVPAFQGDNITDVLAAVVKSNPGWNALPAETPDPIRRLLARCLQKDPKSRLRDIGDALLELEARDDEQARPTFNERGTSGARVGRQMAAVAGALGVGSLVLFGLLLAGYLRSDVVSQPLRLSVTFPEGAQMHLGLPRPSLAVSPDGRKIVYTAAGGPEPPQLWIRDLDQFAPQPLAGTRNARMAVFSPDGRWVAFFADEKLKKIPLTTGPPVVLCDALGAFGATWTKTDEIVFALGRPAGDERGLWRVGAAGGERRKIASGPIWFPDVLPDGNAVLVTMENRAASTSGDLTIAAVDLASGRVTRLFDGGTYARYASTGHLVYLRNGELVAARFDAATLTVADERVPVVTGVYSDPSLPSGNYAFSGSGTLAYVPGDGSHFRRTLMVAGSDGARPLIDERRFYEGPRLSPDGRHVAVMLRAWMDDIWTIDVARGAFTKVTTGALPAAGVPVWSPDGRRVIVSLASDGAGNLFSVPSDGSGSEERLTTSPNVQMPHAFTPDGRILVFSEQRPDTGRDLLTLSLDDRSVRPLLSTRFGETAAALSPDGRWIAYQSDRSGEAQVYVARFPTMEATVQASTGGGTNPVWSRDGRRLYFNRGYFAANIEVVDVVAGASLNLSRTRSVGQFSVAGGVFDVMPDGRLLFVTGSGNDGSTAELHVVVNWFDELKQRVAGRSN